MRFFLFTRSFLSTTHSPGLGSFAKEVEGRKEGHGSGLSGEGKYKDRARNCEKSYDGQRVQVSTEV